MLGGQTQNQDQETCIIKTEIKEELGEIGKLWQVGNDILWAI